MIDSPTESDIDSIVEIAAAAQKLSSIGDFDPDKNVIRQTVINSIRFPHVYIRVLRIDGEVRGVICGMLTPALNLHGDVATDLMFYVEPKYRGHGVRLLDGFIEWAFSFKSVNYVALNVSFVGTEGERTAKFYNRRGYQKAGESFVVRRAQ